jgi:hypothetical protein
MFGFLKFGASGLLVAILAFLLWQQAADRYKVEITSLELRLEACKAVARNVSEDRKSDAEVDNTPDDELVLPPDWLRGNTDSD